MRDVRAEGLLGATAFVLLGLVACNYTDGECFPRDQLYETAGVGASGPILPPGTGGYGEVPKGPQNAPPPPDGPICNRISGGPCDDDCQARYDQASIECGKIVDAAQRQACQDKAHADYSACEVKCEQEPSVSCNRKYDKCQLGKAPAWCRAKVDGTSSTTCQLCYWRCTSGDPPTETCAACGY